MSEEKRLPDVDYIARMIREHLRTEYYGFRVSVAADAEGLQISIEAQGAHRHTVLDAEDIQEITKFLVKTPRQLLIRPETDPSDGHSYLNFYVSCADLRWDVLKYDL